MVIWLLLASSFCGGTSLLACLSRDIFRWRNTVGPAGMAAILERLRHLESRAPLGSLQGVYLAKGLIVIGRRYERG
ncbi:expressed unknown protein [Ectocarpus siliculosus]|uniref:Uncharacterized protein n=1 Tax=Ectocarpus siliculosus TaxID=2880 RepID=D8LHZ8_ECTSI|nr:expressed unknown protein [Ectocarpus siliculosus]|eukprot:CBN74429.1 expressed unknown protein [Ectocarpus siliculosus]